jgi:hypothetical protein
LRHCLRAERAIDPRRLVHERRNILRSGRRYAAHGRGEEKQARSLEESTARGACDVI